MKPLTADEINASLEANEQTLLRKNFTARGQFASNTARFHMLSLSGRPFIVELTEGKALAEPKAGEYYANEAPIGTPRAPTPGNDPYAEGA